MRVRRSLLNFGTTALLVMATMAVGLPATRWLRDWLGDSVLGGVKVVNDAFGWLALLELGLSGAIGPLLARAIGQGDDRTMHETVAAGARVYFGLVLGILALGLALTPIVPWFANGLTPSELVDLRRAWVLQLAAFAPLVLLPLRSIVEARQLGYIVNLLLLMQSLVITGLSLVMARAGWGITGQAASQVIGVWVFSLSLAAGVFWTHPGLLRAIFTIRTRPETRRGLRNLSVPNLVLNLTGRLGLMSDNLIVGRMIDTKNVNVLVQTQRLATMGQSMLQAMGNASWAALAELHAKGDIDTFNRRVIEMTRMVAVLAAIGLVPVIAFNHAFVRIWLPGLEYGGDAVIVLAAINAVLLAEQSLWAWCFSATGKIGRVMPTAIAGAVVNVTVSILMTHYLGLIGPLVGSTVALMTVGLWALPWLLRRTFATPLAALARAVAVPFAVGSLAALALRVLTLNHEPVTWTGIAAAMSLTALVMAALSVVLLLTPEDRALWRQRLVALRAGASS